MSIDLAELKTIQQQFAKQVNMTDQFSWGQPKLVGGADVGFEEEGAITRAAIVILSYPDLALVEYQIVKVPTQFPYIPGYLSFREYPALLEAWNKLMQKPDLLFVDGHGVAHPRGLGIASHLGVLLNIPTIGVAKKRLYGRYNELSGTVGESSPLMDKEKQVGWVLQSKQRCNPLFISSGNNISQSSALYWVKQCLRNYRLPEPTRWSDAVASNKVLFQRYLASKKRTELR